MSSDRSFGQPDGLARRLNTWANQLATNKSFPWVGTGLLDDLRKAAELLGAPAYTEMFPERQYVVKPKLDEPEEDEFAEYRAHIAQYDL